MKKRRGSVLCRCTWYIAQPGSLRDCSVNFSNSAATSASCPTFAIQVTANTTIVSLLPPSWSFGEAILSFFRGCLHLRNEFIHKDRMTAVRTGRDHASPRTCFFLNECQIVPRRLRQLLVIGNALRRSAPTRQFFVNALDLFIAAGLCGRIGSSLPVNFVADADRNLGQFIKHVKLGHHQPRRAVDHPRIPQQRQVEPSRTPWTASHGAKFLASLAQVVPRISFVFAGKGAL